MNHLMLISALLVVQTVSAQAPAPTPPLNQGLTEQQFREVTEKMQTEIKQPIPIAPPTNMPAPSTKLEPAKPANNPKVDMSLAGLACRNKMRGMPCSFSSSREGRIPGVCHSEKRNMTLYCRPSNHPAPREIYEEAVIPYRRPVTVPNSKPSSPASSDSK